MASVTRSIGLEAAPIEAGKTNAVLRRIGNIFICNLFDKNEPLVRRHRPMAVRLTVPGTRNE
jgi:hypothetical protein